MPDSVRRVTKAGKVAFASFLLVSGTGAAPAPGKILGVCWEAAHETSPAQLRPVASLGADWISQTPFGWVSSTDSTEIRLAGTHVLWGETDEGLAKTSAWARSLGIKTLLKPHLWVRGAWCGDIAMTSEEDWARWFASYERFILHYAALAKEQGIEALAVGAELPGISGREREWRALIVKVRAVYPGKLTYCANWYGEPERVAFWDVLDFIGVQAYYPLSDQASPSQAELAAAWVPIAAKLEAVAKRTGKQVVFTEVGFKSQRYGLKEPWRWETDGEVDLELQRRAYTAMYATFWGKPWFGGTFVWKWHPGGRATPRAQRDFTPQDKPALDVIRSVYGKGV